MGHKYKKLKVMVLDFGLSEVKCLTYNVDETPRFISFKSMDGYSAYKALDKDGDTVVFLKSKLDTVIKNRDVEYYMMLSLDKDINDMFDEITEEWLSVSKERVREATQHLAYANYNYANAKDLRSLPITYIPYEYTRENQNEQGDLHG